MVRHQPPRQLEPVDELSCEYGENILIQFCNSEREATGSEFQVPFTTDRDQLLALLRAQLDEESARDDYTLYVAELGQDITETIAKTFIRALKENKEVSSETTLQISYIPRTPFRVRPATRLTGSLQGHQGTVVCLAFSSDSAYMATGSGDCTVRLWDMQTNTPKAALAEHTRAVTAITFSPCNRYLATGSADATILIWEISRISSTGRNVPTSVLKNHSDVITALQFMPVHLSESWENDTPLLASADHRGSIRVWDIIGRKAVKLMDGHTKMVTCLRWSGMMTGSIDGVTEKGPFLYSSSRDMSIRVWGLEKGTALMEIASHGHWVNSLSLNTDGVMRRGPFSPLVTSVNGLEDLKKKAKASWEAEIRHIGEERIVSTSDDNTLAIWSLLKTRKRIAHLTGHQRAVTQALYSPDARYIASASFDGSIRLWDGLSGKYLHVFRGHVSAVYQLSWAADSRLLVSCSKDSTLKIWDTQARKLKTDLPGAADEIYAVAWSENGLCIASGGKDKIVRLWNP